MSTAIYEVKRLAGVKAPEGFAERVLAQVGAADSYAAFETVLGPVYVAWSRFGVSAAMRQPVCAQTGVRRLRPVRRRFRRMPRPLFLELRFRKPCCRLRRIFDG